MQRQAMTVGKMSLLDLLPCYNNILSLSEILLQIGLFDFSLCL